MERSEKLKENQTPPPSRTEEGGKRRSNSVGLMEREKGMALVKRGRKSEEKEKRRASIEGRNANR